MKRVIIFLTLISLIISTIVPICLADEEVTEETVATEMVEQVDDDINEMVVNTYGKIIESNGVREVITGSVVDQVQEVVVLITKGDYIEQEYKIDYVLSYDLEGKMLVPQLDVGDKVEVQITEDKEGNVTATINDVSRTNNIIWVLILFIISIVIIGGKKGIKTVLGITYALIVIYFFFIKNLYNGTNAYLATIIATMFIIVGTFAIICGINRKTFSASIGTFGGILISGIIAVIFFNVSKLTGGFEEATELSVDLSLIKFNFKDLLFASIMIASLGACMDISLIVVTALDNLKLTNSEITWQELFKKGIEAGRESIGTMTNTLILAYVGSTLTIILLFLACNMSLLEILSKEKVIEHFMFAIIGSMGVLYTIPITSIAYSLLNRHKIVYRRVAENKLDGKRSLKL